MQIKKKTLRKFGTVSFFVLPALIIVITLIVAPLLMSMFNSLFSWNQMVRLDFIGFDNFKALFTKYPYQERFFNALKNNAQWFVMTMVIQNGFGLLFGYLLSRRIAGSEFFKRVFFLPVLFSIVAVGFLWGLYLSPNGLLNAILKATGKPEWQQAWLGNAKYANNALILVNIWRWVGFPSLVFLAAIDMVPVESIEASLLDGANSWQTFWKVIFPLIIPSLTIVFVLTIIGSLNVFEQVYCMTGLDGSPNFATDTIGTLFYRTAFGSVDAGNPEIGMGSAISVVIYLLTFCFSLISIVTTRSKEVEL
ncbi:MAG: sugar ABC transporter permease [Spirochaetia bacterium]|jgi:raffinose/stachyose/melibiose transport system permease protein|nr:sugar ABC transporter permease [Spirochaetia bacterium]